MNNVANRKRSITYTVFNIRTHPHKPQGYVDLFYKAFDLKKQINLAGEKYCIITQIAQLGKDPLNGLSGEIARYTKIETNKWFNLSELRAAVDDETKEIKIPEELRPNFKNFSFVFYPKNHYLVIECKDRHGKMSPQVIEKYFNGLFSTDEIVNEFGTIEITLVPQTDQLDTLFAVKQITNLELVLRRPNTDGLEDLDDEVLTRLNQQNAEEEMIILKAQRGCSIVADDRTKALSHVAQLNGEVKVKGNDANGKHVELSTRQHAFTYIGQYFSGENTAKLLLEEVSKKIIKKVKKMGKPRRKNV